MRVFEVLSVAFVAQSAAGAAVAHKHQNVHEHGIVARDETVNACPADPNVVTIVEVVEMTVTVVEMVPATTSGRSRSATSVSSSTLSTPIVISSPTSTTASLTSTVVTSSTSTSSTTISTSTNSAPATPSPAPEPASPTTLTDTSTALPDTSTALPETFTALPETSTALPEASTVTSESSSQATQQTSIAGGSGDISRNTGKRGALYQRVQNIARFSQPGRSSKVSWAWDWSSMKYTWAPGDLFYGITTGYNDALEFVPEFNKLGVADIERDWNDHVANADLSALGIRYLFSFTEPDSCDGKGSCMSVATAVEGYRKFIQPLAGKAKLGSPSVTSTEGDPNKGIRYLKSFIEQCTGCQIDFVNAHWYANYQDDAFDNFKAYIDKFYDTFKKPVWVTEFGLWTGSVQQQEDFLKKALEYLDKNDNVERYSYFWAHPENSIGAAPLVSAEGSLTSIGEIYDTYPSGCYNRYEDHCA